MTNEEIDKKLAELDAKHVEVERVKQKLLVNIDELNAEQFRLQGEYRAYKGMKIDPNLPVMDVAPAEPEVK